MQKITPHLWFDKEAKEAAELYAASFKSAFGDAAGDTRIVTAGTLDDTPSGSVEMLNFKLLGQEFSAISAGPYFTLNPSISFFVATYS